MTAGGGLQKSKMQPDDVEVGGQSPDDDAAVRLTYDSLHDLVGPANQICTLAGLLIRQCGSRLGPESADLAALIQASINDLRTFLDGFRMYAQIAGPRARCEPCDGDTLLQASLASLQSLVEDTGAYVTQDALPEIYCDPTQIAFVFTALVENSIKFRSESRPEVHVAAASSEEAWVFSVRDNGIGIDRKYHRRIFEMFRRVHNKQYAGAGVGLTITERIVQGHGGKIWVESELGQGATFYFALPRAAGP